MTQKPTRPDKSDEASRKPVPDSRCMVKAELLGKHLHQTEVGVTVGIYLRQDKYLGRGRINGQRFGKTLGADEATAERELRHLLVSIENGSFVRPSETRQQVVKTQSVPRLTVRELCAKFLAEKKTTIGGRSTKDYKSRLTPMIEFAEQDESRRRWPLAGSIDREFAVAFAAFLQSREVARNGRPNATAKPMSARQIENVLQCVVTMLNWAKQPDVNNLPVTFVCPFDKRAKGRRPRRDPLEENPLPLEQRIRLVALMDNYQLLHFAIPFTCPLRPDEYTALLISDVDFNQQHLICRTRLEGRDFNKGQQNFRVPFPPAVAPLLWRCIGGRPAGPLLRMRSDFTKSRPRHAGIQSTDDIAQIFYRRLAQEGLENPEDAKQLFRKLLQELGGASPNTMYKEFQKPKRLAGLPADAVPYDLRGAVSTDLQNAGVSHLVQRYVTGHTTSDILNSYVSLKDSVQREMQQYFEFIQPLLAAISRRAGGLGITVEDAA